MMRTYRDLTEGTASDIEGQLAEQADRLRRRLARIRHTVAVMSGKGGVGKSIIAANLAVALAERGLTVGAVDGDINGPSLARLLGVDGARLASTGESVEPPRGAAGVRVMSMDLLLSDDEAPVEWTGPAEDRFLWRSTAEATALRDFLSDTDWGELDYLVVDLAPGTGSLAALHDLVPGLDGVIAVTVPSRLSRFVVRKSVTLARRQGTPLLGYVENMSGYACPDCGRVGPLFDAEAGSGPFEDIERLASLPFDPRFGRESDAGRPGILERPESGVARELHDLASKLRARLEGSRT